MKCFLRLIACFLGVPFLIICGLYFITDPYKTLKPFSLEYFDDTNRDYLSSELFLKNYQTQHYDSFVFGSSRCGGINTYHWLKFLPEDSHQFLFQAWGETLTGIEEKIDFIDEHGCDIKNALILLDCPDSFAEDQHPTKALSIKHPSFSHQTEFVHQTILLFDFAQKPSQWIQAIKKATGKEPSPVSFDTVSNDWDGTNRMRDLSCPPHKDSLNNMSDKSRNIFLWENTSGEPRETEVSNPVIDDNFERQLKRILVILQKHNTDYRIIITPAYCYSFPAINDKDFSILCSIFGAGNVFNYSGYNVLTSDYNNFSDPNHFGLYVGWHIIENIYDGRPLDTDQ